MHINKRKRLRKDLKIHAHMHIGLKGFFTVELIEAATGRIKRHLEFENLIVDAGLDGLNNTPIGTFIGAAGTNAYMAVGTSSTAPANNQTGLIAEISPSSSNRTNSNGGIAEVFGAGASNVYWYRKITFNFVEAQGNGNLTELGILTAVTGGTLFCRQLFKDGGGTPTTVVKTSADQLRVTYEIRFYNPAQVDIASLAISGSNYQISTRAIHIDNARSWGVDATNFCVMVGFKGDNANAVLAWNAIDTNTLCASSGANPAAGSLTVPTSVAKSTYVNGNFWLDYTVIWDPGIANPVGGIGGVIMTAQLAGDSTGATKCQFQIEFTPKLPKDNTKRLTLVMRLSWGRGP